jgi:ubiquinone/menaquinone biosynthesis C-methylase UbiE
MAVPFDHIAGTYDSVFTRSAIGQLQRKHVWKYLEKVIPELSGLEMLELNCGTGEDALMFSDKGFNIIATDVSTEMLKVTEQKAERYSMQHKISSHYLDLESFSETLFDKKFDLIFSNFGGLNCVSPEALQKVFQKIPMMLNEGGRFICVIMPKFCLWESIYYFAKFKFGEIFRRYTSHEVIANLHGTMLKTWYYSPSQVRNWTKNNFEVVRTQPVGITLPPSYLDTFFLRKKKFLISLHQLEKKVNRYSMFSGMADHFIIDLKLK